MFKFLSMFNLLVLTLPQTNSQYVTSPVGGTRDTNGCMIGAGYTWCESSQSCIRQWATPCLDNFNGCSDCLTKQRKGMNIACPAECDVVVDHWRPIATDPLVIDPLVIDPLPVPEPPVGPCPDVMCMMYCENGFLLDDNGCNLCSCLSPIPMTPPVINDLLNPVPDLPGECPIPPSYCDNEYF